MTVSDVLMKEFLQKMPSEPVTTRKLSSLLERNDSNVRRVMLAMKALGIVEQIETAPNRYVWRKLVTI
jgi:predicted transcriptional regulator